MSATDTNIGKRKLQVAVDKGSSGGDWSAETTYSRKDDGTFEIIGVAYRDKKGRWMGCDGFTPAQMKKLNSAGKA